MILTGWLASSPAPGKIAFVKMDEYDGKQFLATMRSADYAHAGEAESIDLVFAMIPAQPSWQVLDVGCGRGGTADYVNRHGWGHVVGIDIDEAAIESAQTKYPQLEFSVCDIHAVGDRFPAQFDLIYLFNVFYAAIDKNAAISNFKTAAKPGGLLCIFDYVLYNSESPLPKVFLDQTPATPDEFAEYIKVNSMRVISHVNLDAEYIQWYRSFLKRFDNPALIAQYSPDVVDEVRSKYEELFDSLEKGNMGGLLLLASAV